MNRLHQHRTDKNGASPATQPLASGLLQRKCACGGSAGLAGECEECRKNKLVGEAPQMKLMVNQPGDIYEQEADRVADEVVRMDSTPPRAMQPISASLPPLQRQEDVAEISDEDFEMDDEEEGIESGMLKREQGRATDMASGTASVDIPRGGGRSLDAETLSYMGDRIGHDFGHVRIHTDSRAVESARDLNAQAYTVGSDIYFNEGRYDTHGLEGRKLLAHELTHVVQQQREARPALQRDKKKGGSKKGGTKKGTKKKGGAKKKKNNPLTFDEVKKHVISNNKSTASTEALICLIWKESGFDPKDKSSSSSATGLMQITKPAVADVNRNSPKGVHFTHGEMTDPAKNIDCASRYLQMRIKREGGDIKKGMNGFGTGTGYADNILVCETCLQGKGAKQDDCLHAIHK